MLERQRHHYLSVFGIDQYIPYRRLPGAAVSKLLSDEALQPVDMNAQLRSQSQSQAPQEQQAASNIDLNLDTSETEQDSNPISQKLLCDVPEAEEPVSSVSEPVQESPQENNSQDQSSNTVVRFLLNIWRVSDDCLVIDSRQPATALPTDRLLQNILRAIGYPLVQLPPREMIRWPIFSQDPLADDAEQARAMVQAFISAQDKKSSLAKIILMGEEASRFALDHTDNPFDELCGHMCSHQLWQAKIAVTPSLHAMLHEPMTKAMAWQVLQKL